MGWRIDYDGHVFREGDVTIGQAEKMETLTGSRWTWIDPVIEARHARAVLSVMYASAVGCTVDEAAEKVEAIKVNDFLDMHSIEKDDLPAVYEEGIPQPADGTSTPT